MILGELNDEDDTLSYVYEAINRDVFSHSVDKDPTLSYHNVLLASNYRRKVWKALQEGESSSEVHDNLFDRWMWVDQSVYKE